MIDVYTSINRQTLVFDSQLALLFVENSTLCVLHKILLDVCKRTDTIPEKILIYCNVFQKIIKRLFIRCTTNYIPFPTSPYNKRIYIYKCKTFIK